MKSITRATLLALALNLIFLSSVAAQTSGDTPPPDKSIAEDDASLKKASNAKQESGRSEKPHFTFYFRLSSKFESDIERDLIDVRSFGLVPSIGFNYENGSSKNPVEINYEGAYHNYTNANRWDRMSNAMSVSYGRRLSDRFRAKTEVEVSLKGDSEDRDLDNRFTVSQRLEYRPFRTTRLQGYAAYRIKKDPIDARNDAINPFFGGRWIQRVGEERSFEVGYRFESNRTEDPEGRYIRWKYEGQYTTPFLRRGQLTVSASYRPSLYQRTVRGADRVRVVRKDRRWDFDVTWERHLRENLYLELFYELDKRNSNDPRKIFTAHTAGVSLIYRWQW